MILVINLKTLLSKLKVVSSCLNLVPILSGALADLGVYAKCMYRTLRKLKRYSVVVNDLLKTLINLPSIDAVSI